MRTASTLSAIDYLTSPLLSQAGFRHAFFTRQGGVSEGAFATLNFSVTVGDQAPHVEENLRRAAAALGVAAGRVYFASQVHGCSVEVADGETEFAEFVRREADVVVARSSEIACGVRSADCVPVLLAERGSGRVAAVHAGWRGVVRGAVKAGVDALLSEAGQRADIIAAIGPHISLAAFEVSDEVAAELEAASPNSNVVDRSRLRPHVDLRSIVRAQLESVGVSRDCIDDVAGCTFLEPRLFFSFRRDGKASGRHLSAIVPK
ncbi:MAG: peptidoglycan editing factor PgeF [Polyangiaceae bacterium]